MSQGSLWYTRNVKASRSLTFTNYSQDSNVTWSIKSFWRRCSRQWVQQGSQTWLFYFPSRNTNCCQHLFFLWIRWCYTQSRALWNFYSCTLLRISKREQILCRCSLRKCKDQTELLMLCITTGCFQTLHPAGFDTLGQVTLLGISFFFCVAPWRLSSPTLQCWDTPAETCGDTCDCFSPAYLTSGDLLLKSLLGSYRYKRPQFLAHLHSNNCSNHIRPDLPFQTPLPCFSPLPDAWKSCCASLRLCWEIWDAGKATRAGRTGWLWFL